MAKRKSKPKATARRKAQLARERKFERESIRESIRASERAGQLKRARDERESLRLSEQERKRAQAAERVAERAPRSVTAKLTERYERLAEISPHPLTVHVINSPTGEGLLPWLLLGEFYPEAPLRYTELNEIILKWESDYMLTAKIGPQRLAWIRWVYQRHDQKGNPIGGPEGFSQGGAGAYDKVISESAASSDPGDDEPSRENTTTIGLIELYFAANDSMDFFKTQAADRLKKRRRREK